MCPKSNWKFEVLGFEGMGKLEYPEKNLSELGKGQITKSTHVALSNPKMEIL